MKKKLYFLTLLSIFLLFLTVGTVSAEYLGGKWKPGMTIMFDRSSLVSSYTTSLRDASKKWNDIANITLKYRPDTDARVVHIWAIVSQNEDYYAAKGYYAFGIPGPEYNSGTYVRGDLEIVRPKMNSLSSEKKTQIFTHEFGHLLGLAHTTKWFTKSVMDESDVFKVNGPTSYDKENLRKLY